MANEISPQMVETLRKAVNDLRLMIYLDVLLTHREKLEARGVNDVDSQIEGALLSTGFKKPHRPGQ